MYLFLNIAKFADLWSKNADFSRTHSVHHVIQVLFGSYLVEV